MTQGALPPDSVKVFLKCNAVELAAQRFDRLSAARAWHDNVNAL
jgi:hypothetical protein